ncbi:cytochrome P450 [Streptomyces hyaluromycini]|uniref:Cytochrome P450 n=1 Tax=Streptomyces hyaluromycini TaxID=1377993 RepID=A0ABV1X6G1_9ACTN
MTASAASMANWTIPDTDAELLAWFDEMRATDPVQRDPERGGWHVFGYAEAEEALRNWEAFSSDTGGDVPDDSPMQIFRSGNLSWMDPPRHRQLRALMREAFTPKYTAGLQPMIIDTVDGFIAGIEGKDDVDFVDEYAAPVAAAVAANMLGIPESDRFLFGRWTRGLMTLADPTTQQNEVGRIIAYSRDIKLYLEALVRNRRRLPKGDFISRLTVAEVDGERLQDAEIMGMITLMLLTAQTSTQTIGNAVLCMDQFPAAERELRSDPELIHGFMEEVMRCRAQTSRVARITSREVVLGQHEIPARQPVSVWLSAANFDPAKFTDPHAFDPRRSPNQHLALGHGVHFCLGAPLSRMESELAVSRLLARARRIEVDHTDAQLLDPRLVFGPSRLRVRFAW